MYKFKVKAETFCLGLGETDFEEVEVYTVEEFSKLTKDQKQKHSQDEFHWLDFIIDQPENPGSLRKLKDLVDENCLEDFKEFIKEDICELNKDRQSLIMELLRASPTRDFVILY